MHRGNILFNCESCGRRFVGPDYEWNCGPLSIPFRCPICDSTHTYPSRWGKDAYMGYWDKDDRYLRLEFDHSLLDKGFHQKTFEDRSDLELFMLQIIILLHVPTIICSAIPSLSLPGLFINNLNEAPWTAIKLSKDKDAPIYVEECPISENIEDRIHNDILDKGIKLLILDCCVPDIQAYKEIAETQGICILQVSASE